MTTPKTTWLIEWMDVKPADAGLTDVVITAGWRCNGTDGTYNGTVYSTCSFSQPSEGGTFTAYADLTQDQVLGWVWNSGVDKNATEAAVVQQIEMQANPPVIQPPLPWAA